MLVDSGSAAFQVQHARLSCSYLDQQVSRRSELLPHNPVEDKACLSARQQIPASTRFRAQQEHGLSLLPDTSFRNSQSFASDPIMVWKFATKNAHVWVCVYTHIHTYTYTRTYIHTQMHKPLILAQNFRKYQRVAKSNFDRSQMWATGVSQAKVVCFFFYRMTLFPKIYYFVSQRNCLRPWLCKLSKQKTNCKNRVKH